MSEQLNVNSCEMYGKIIVIKRTGEDSASFELVDDSYTFGRAAECDIRIQLLSIAEEHVKITRNEHGQAVLVKFNDDCSVNINNMPMKESSRVLEHNDIITLVERSFRYQYTPEMLARAQLANQGISNPSGTISISAETPKKPSNLSASVFSVSELPSSPVTPKTPVPVSRSGSVSTGQSPMVSSVVDNEITTSPKLSPKVFKMENDSLNGVIPLNMVGASSLGTSVVSSTDEHKECDKENFEQVVEVCKPETDNAVEDKNMEVATEETNIELENVEPVCEDMDTAAPVADTVFEPMTEINCDSVKQVSCEALADIDVAVEPVIETVTENVIETVCEPSESISETVCKTVTEIIKSETVIEAVVETKVNENAICDAEITTEIAFSSEVTNETACNNEVSEPVAEVNTETVTFTETPATVEEVPNESMAVDESITESSEHASAVITDSVEEAADVHMETSEVVAETVESIDVTSAVTEMASETVYESSDVLMTESTTEVTESTETMICERTEVAVESAEPVETNVMDCKEFTENVTETCMDGVCESVAPIESEMTVEPSVENSMEGIEETTEVIVEQQSESIEAPVVVEQVAETVSVVADGDKPEMVMNEISGDTMESEVVETSEDIESVEIAECVEADKPTENFVSESVESCETVEDETVKTKQYIESEAVETIETTETSEPTQSVETVDPVTIVTEVGEPVANEPVIATESMPTVVETPVIEEVTASATEVVNEEEDEESIPIVELPDEEIEESSEPLVTSNNAVASAELEILVESEELASVEIETSVGVESKLASPKRSESVTVVETETPSTPAPIRKSTRVHVTPAALESVKKQQNSPQIPKQRTSSRVTRSRVTDTPASPKNRTQKRQKSNSDDDDDDEEDENVELYENNNNSSHIEKKTKTTDSKTPVRRSTRSRVNQK